VLAAIVLLGAGAVAVAGRLVSSGYFEIQSVRVTGAERSGADSIIAASGIRGQNYFFVDSAAAAQRLRALPWVREARVTRRFPHSATITITERTPLGIWRVGAVAYLVDSEGMVLDAPSDVSADSLPVVDAGQLGEVVQVGARVDPDPLRTAETLAQQPDGSVAHSIARLEFDKDMGMTATTDSGLLVRLGDGRDLDLKLAVWRAALAAASANDMHILDVRDPNHPYYR
jgi:cell division protein FtsQ